MKKLVLVWMLFLIPLFGISRTVGSFKKLNDRVTIILDRGLLEIVPLKSNAVRVRYMLHQTPTADELVFTSKMKTPDFKVIEGKTAIEIRMSELRAIVDKNSGTLSYLNGSGKPLLRERQGERILRDSSVQGEHCYCAEQGFYSPADEFLYGTGQFQDGFLNIRGLSRRLTQVNSQISIPMIVSSKGYGLLWHNYGLTEFNPADLKVKLEAVGHEKNGETVNVTSTEGTKKEERKEVDFAGEITVGEGGRYGLLLDVGQRMGRIWQLSVDGKRAIDIKNYWLPPTVGTIVSLEKGTHRITVTGNDGDSPTVYYRKVTDATVFRSPVADAIDYVVFSGNADQVISAYRDLSGRAPLMPSWSLGYLHCRERYTSQQELLDNAREFRKRHLPIDMIIQDWQYWGKYGWNAMQFDETQYPDAAAMVSDLHRMNMHLMLSVWSRVDPQSVVGRELTKNGYYIANTQWVDFMNPKAAECYWKNFSCNLLKKYHIDAWWQDATEPENDDLAGRKICNNTIVGERLRNVYPLYVTKTVYEGLRRDEPDKRVFILTRCAFSGEQRYAAAVWSGDVGNDWDTMRRQLRAGLNYSVSGLPWWTFDAGGFFRPGSGQYEDAAYQERMLRWFEMATLCPLQRVHGYQTNTEFWRYGEKVERDALRYLNLRYRLMPYIYSQAAEITFKNGTLMRPLVMDFSNDRQALSQNDEYMFGRAFLVAPVLEAGVSTWKVYLPENKAGWFDFWTGNHVDGGQTVAAKAPISIIPLYVRGGCIVPMGQKMEYTGQTKNDTIELRIYKGADAGYSLYEDEGTNYNYEKGKYAVIGFHWNDGTHCLTIDKRKGDFQGLLKERYFNVVVVDNSKGCGLETNTEGKLVKYAGLRMKVVLK